MIPKQMLETLQAKAGIHHDLMSRITLQTSIFLTTKIEPDEDEFILRNNKHYVDEWKHQHGQKWSKGNASESVERFQILEICNGSVDCSHENHKTSNHLYSPGESRCDGVLFVHAGNNIDYCDECIQWDKDEFANQRERVSVDEELKQDHDLDIVRKYLPEAVVGIVVSSKTNHHRHCAAEEPQDCIFKESDFPHADRSKEHNYTCDIDNHQADGCNDLEMPECS